MPFQSWKISQYPEVTSWVTSTRIIIRCIFSFLSIGWESTTWPANNCLQIMVCSCVVPSKRVAANNILLKRNWNHVLERKMADRFPELPGSEWQNNYWTRLSQNIMICQCLADPFYLPQPSASANILIRAGLFESRLTLTQGQALTEALRFLV